MAAEGGHALAHQLAAADGRSAEGDRRFEELDRGRDQVEFDQGRGQLVAAERILAAERLRSVDSKG
jgi:hypothetical protein